MQVASARSSPEGGLKLDAERDAAAAAAAAEAVVGSEPADRAMEKENMSAASDAGSVREAGSPASETLPASTPAKPVRLRPALRGVLKRGPGGLTWEGSWGMDDAAFDGGVISPFSYTRVKLVDEHAASALPSDLMLVNEAPDSDVLHKSLFTGHFFMFIAGKRKRIPETNVLMEFLPHDEDVSDSLVKVRGSGSNEFGTYTLEGSLVLKTGELNVYREYTVMAPAPAAARAPRAKPIGRPKKTRPTVAPALQRSPSSPSDSLSAPARNQRMRRTPSHLVEDMLDEKEAEDLIKLKNIVREVFRADKEGWFQAPVDAEGLGLANYREVVTHPMDLGTVLKRFDLKEYTTVEGAVEDVRLTFSNAILYNADGTAVNAAAKRLRSLFEQHLSKLSSYKTRPNRKRKKDSISGDASTTSSGAAKRSKPPSGPAPLLQRKSMSDVFGSSDEEGGAEEEEEDDDVNYGPGSASVGAADEDFDDDADFDDEPAKRKRKRAPAAAKRTASKEVVSTDVEMLQKQVELMSKKIQMMHEMQAANLKQLMEPVHRVNQQIHAPPAKAVAKPRRSSESRPLSYQEKRQLGQDINKLPGDMIEGVIKIIQESGTVLGGDDDDGEEVELDIEALDTPAQKKLQKYVKRCLIKARSQQAQDIF